jgi:RNase P/RNase MRP subunit POP5
MKYKKKLNVIRPTLRHKKKYIELKLLNTNSINNKINNNSNSNSNCSYNCNKLNILDAYELHKVFYKNFQKVYGLFSQINVNITVIDFNKNNNVILIRINSLYIKEFVSSLFFLNNELGLFKINKIGSTIKSLNCK